MQQECGVISGQNLQTHCSQKTVPINKTIKQWNRIAAPSVDEICNWFWKPGVWNWMCDWLWFCKWFYDQGIHLSRMQPTVYF